MIGAPPRRLLAARRAGGALVLAASIAFLAERAVVGVHATADLSGAPGSGIGSWWVVTVGMVVLTGTGAMPAWRLVGRRPLAVFLAPCIGAVLAAVSSVVTIGVASEPLRWFVAFAAAVNAAALASLAAAREGRAAGGQAPPGGQRRRVLLRIGPTLGVAIAVSAYAASGLGQPALSGSASSSWLALAVLLTHGHHAVHPVLAGSTAAGAHLALSPLASGCAAVTWLLTGTRGTAAAASVVGLVTVSALGAATCAVIEMGGSRPSAGRTGRRAQVAGAVAIAAGACFGLAAFGTTPAAAFDGTLTPLWSVGACGAAVLGLALEPSGWRLRGAVVLGAAAALTTPAGGVVDLGLVILVTVRRATAHRRGSGVAGQVADVVGGIVAAAAVVAWPVVAVVVGVGPVRLGLPSADLAARLHGAWSAMAPGLLPAAAGGIIAVVSSMLLGRVRSGIGLGSDVGSVVVALGAIALALAAAGWDVPTVRAWFTEPDRSAAVLPVMLAMASASAWAVTGLRGLLGWVDPVGTGPGAPGAGPGGPAGAGQARPVPGSRAPGAVDGTAGAPGVTVPREAGPEPTGEGARPGDGMAPRVDDRRPGVLHPRA